MIGLKFRGLEPEIDLGGVAQEVNFQDDRAALRSRSALRGVQAGFAKSVAISRVTIDLRTPSNSGLEEGLMRGEFINVRIASDF
jgi:hypothetical protein